MPYSLRPFNPATDYPAVARLVNVAATEPVLPEQVQERDQQVTSETEQRTMAVAENGQVVGYFFANRFDWMKPGTFTLRLIVAPEHRRQGVGSLLYQAAVAFMRENGGEQIRVEIRDDDPASQRFAEKRGGRLERHIFDSTIDLSTYDETPFAGTVEGLEAQGFRFLSVAEAPDREAAERSIYELFRDTTGDIPGEDGGFGPYDEFAGSYFAASWYRPEGAIMAMHGDTCAAVSVVGYRPKTNAFYTHGTGVRREFRGRHLALAVKLLSLRYAKRCGAAYVRTENDSLNAPMLAVNRKLGFQPQAGVYVYLLPM